MCARLEARRFAVLEVGEDHRQDHTCLATIYGEMENGGREALLDYVMRFLRTSAGHARWSERTRHGIFVNRDERLQHVGRAHQTARMVESPPWWVTHGYHSENHQVAADRRLDRTGHVGACPLTTQKRRKSGRRLTSREGHNRTHAPQQIWSLEGAKHCALYRASRSRVRGIAFDLWMM
jgi:hypothetical protein